MTDMPSVEPSVVAMGVAARLWCEPGAAKSGMDVAVALEMAKRIDIYHDLIERAWGIIANSSGGNWDDASPEWRGAAERWRDGYHKMLDDDLVTHHREDR